MRARSALIAAVVVALAASTPATAVKKKKPKPPPPLCNLATDESGDGKWGPQGAADSKALDVVSADIATGKQEFVAVLRLGSTDMANDSWARLGFSWFFGATGSGVDYDFKAVRATGGMSSDLSSTVTVGGKSIDHKFEVVGNALVWKFDRKLVAAMTKPAIVWTDFGGQSKVFGGSADQMNVSKKRYPDRHPSCVAAK